MLNVLHRFYLQEHLDSYETYYTFFLLHCFINMCSQNSAPNMCMRYGKEATDILQNLF